MDQDMDTTDFTAQEVEDAIASEFPNVSALLREKPAKFGSPFDRFAVDTTMDSRPMTTSDLEFTPTDFRTRQSASKHLPPSTFNSPFVRPSQPLFSGEDSPASYASSTSSSPLVHQPLSTPFSHHAPQFHQPQPQHQQSFFQPSASHTSPRSPLTAAQQASKLGFSMMGGGDERPEEDSFFSELWELSKMFKKKVAPLSTVTELSKLFAEFCDSRAETLLKSLPIYSSIMPNQEQLKEQTGVNLAAERNTWMLFYELNADRHTSTPSDLHTPSQVQFIENALVSDAALKRNLVVLHWLESLYSHLYGDQERSTWPNTIHILQTRGNEHPYVRHIDPDAPFRETKKLHEDDAKEEEMFLEALWGLYRGGKQALEASEFCAKNGQAWRAASVMGGALFSNEFETGNPNRNTWRNACNELAKNGTNNPYEKAVYGLLSQDLDCVLPVCKTWEDHLWVQLKMWSDAYIDTLLQSAPHPFAEQDEMRKHDYSIAHTKLLKDMLDELKDTPRITSSNLGLAVWYHEVQKYIILSDHSHLLQRLADFVKDSQAKPEFIRFAAHLVLAYRFRSAAIAGTQPNSPHFSSVWVADPRSDAVIEAYVRYLIQAKKHDMVALYTSFLPPKSQINTYAQFLSQKSIREKSDKQHLLEKAEEAGLDTKSIILRVAELNIKQGDQPSQDRALTVVQQPAARMELTEADTKRLKGIEWLCFDDSQIIDALVQSNVVIHEFLETGKMEAVSKLISGATPILPSDIVTQVLARASDNHTNDIALAIREHLAYKSLLNAHDTFNAWHAHHVYAPAPPPQPAGPKRSAAAADIAHQVAMKKHEAELRVWADADQKLSEEARGSIMSMLYFEYGWLCNLEETKRKFDIIRRRYIPEAIFMLQRVLHDSRRFKSSVGIARKVASERWKLYTTFNQTELQKLMVLIEESAKALLASGCPDPTGYTIDVAEAHAVDEDDSVVMEG